MIVGLIIWNWMHWHFLSVHWLIGFKFLMERNQNVPHSYSWLLAQSWINRNSFGRIIDAAILLKEKYFESNIFNLKPLKWKNKVFELCSQLIIQNSVAWFQWLVNIHVRNFLYKEHFMIWYWRRVLILLCEDLWKLFLKCVMWSRNITKLFWCQGFYHFVAIPLVPFLIVCFSLSVIPIFYFDFIL